MAYSTMGLVLSVIATALAIFLLPGSLELLILSIAGVLKQPKTPCQAKTLPKMAIIVPAHNEEDGIADCIDSLRNGIGTCKDTDIVVIADNCSDGTAARADALGMRVLVRENTEQRGKGYALDFAFRQLLDEGYQGFVIVDADSRVTAGFASTFQQALGSGLDALQCRYQLLNAQTSWRTSLQHIALLGFNVLRLRGRQKLGLSVGILGNGFALSRDTLLAVPYDATSIAEDLEYHLRLVRAGRKVSYIDTVTVLAAAPTQQQGASVQRSRWEGGRFRLIADEVPGLIRAVLAGHWLLLEPLAELLLLPLAFHALLVAVLLLLPTGLAIAGGLLYLTVLLLHLIAIFIVGHCGWRELKILASVPFYLIWKLALLPRLWRSMDKNAAWERTVRETNDHES